MAGPTRSWAALAMLVVGCVVAMPAAARDCRPADAPPGVRSPERPGWKPREKPSPPERERLRPGREPGFVDLGNGTQIRIGGSVRVEGKTRR